MSVACAGLPFSVAVTLIDIGTLIFGVCVLTVNVAESGPEVRVALVAATAGPASASIVMIVPVTARRAAVSAAGDRGSRAKRASL
jgi:hypothetical protein